MKKQWYYWLFPRKCPGCGEVIDYRSYYCESCIAKLPYIPDPRCEYCGMAKADCSCQKHKHAYASIAAPFYYEGVARRAVLLLKRYSVYAEPLSQACGEVVQHCYGSEDFDLVTAVPMHSKRFKVTGFNHSEVLAKQLAAQMGVPYVMCLRNLYYSKAQHNLGIRFRFGNVRGIYEVTDPSVIRGKRILLVDDIKTTGATFNECARMLQLEGALSVKAVCAAIARR